VEWHNVVAVVVGSLLISFLATIYPAWRAARIDPVEGLRYE
jgi:lipoprotein-releasing system permease protein